MKSPTEGLEVASSNERAVGLPISSKEVSSSSMPTKKKRQAVSRLMVRPQAVRSSTDEREALEATSSTEGETKTEGDPWHDNVEGRRKQNVTPLLSL